MRINQRPNSLGFGQLGGLKLRSEFDFSGAAHSAHHLVHHTARFVEPLNLRTPCCMGNPLATGLVVHNPTVPQSNERAPCSCQSTGAARTGLLWDLTGHSGIPAHGRQPPFLLGYMQGREPIVPGSRFRKRIQVPLSRGPQIKQVKVHPPITARFTFNGAT